MKMYWGNKLIQIQIQNCVAFVKMSNAASRAFFAINIRFIKRNYYCCHHHTLVVDLLSEFYHFC